MSASASHMKLSLDHSGVFYPPDLTRESAAKASKVLQEKHEKHHIFFNQRGFHNHIAHQILTLSQTYQRKAQPFDNAILEDLHDYNKFHGYLGNEKYCHDYLGYVRGEIDKKGYAEVIDEYCLKGDEWADDILLRLCAGFLHSIIHLGFGIEFKPPAIIAKALAHAAVQDSWIVPFMLDAEKAAASSGKSKSMVGLLDEVRADKALSSAAKWGTIQTKIRDGILVRAPGEMICIAAKWKVMPDVITGKTAEMTDTAVYYTGGAQHPPKQIKFDFYYMHCVNCSIFYDAFLKEATWVSDENKVRLLEWKGRLDLCMYASRRPPEPRMDVIEEYEPKRPALAKDTGGDNGCWDRILSRVIRHNGDGHAAKLVRALAHGENICAAYSMNNPLSRIKGDMWLQLGQMAMDSVEDTGDAWVRSAGFPEAWEKHEDRPQAQL